MSWFLPSNKAGMSWNGFANAKHDYDRATKPAGEAQANTLYETALGNEGKVASGIDGINAQFGYGDSDFARANAAAREAQIGTVAADTTNANLNQLNLDRRAAARRLLFQVARNGLSGGSVHAEQEGDQAEGYARGVVAANQAGYNAGEAFRSNTEQQRQSLIQQYAGGMTAQQALEASQAQANAAVQAAKNTAAVNSYAGLFSSFGTGYGQAGNTGYGA